MLRENRRTWEKATAVGALAISLGRRRVRLLFSLHANENIHAAWLIHFLRELERHLGPASCWSGQSGTAQEHRTPRLLGRQRSIRVWSLPPYAPELNPIELVWGQATLGPLANWAPEDVTALQTGATSALDQIALNQPLLRSLLRGVPLSLRLR